jgi:hypothetical protein
MVIGAVEALPRGAGGHGVNVDHAVNVHLAMNTHLAMSTHSTNAHRIGFRGDAW